MLSIFAFHMARNAFKGSKAGAKLSGLLQKEVHPRVFRAYYVAGIVVYGAHIAVSMRHGFEVEGCATAAAAALELLAHLCGAG